MFAILYKPLFNFLFGSQQSTPIDAGNNGTPPSPFAMHRTPTSGPVRTLKSSKLTPEEMREIIENPYRTHFTYADSASYKPNGPTTYTIPRLPRPNAPAIEQPPWPRKLGNGIWESLTPVLFSLLSMLCLALVLFLPACWKSEVPSELVCAKQSNLVKPVALPTVTTDVAVFTPSMDLGQENSLEHLLALDFHNTSNHMDNDVAMFIPRMNSEKENSLENRRALDFLDSNRNMKNKDEFCAVEEQPPLEEVGAIQGEVATWEGMKQQGTANNATLPVSNGDLTTLSVLVPLHHPNRTTTNPKSGGFFIGRVTIRIKWLNRFYTHNEIWGLLRA